MGRIRIGVSGWSYDDWRGDGFLAQLPHDTEAAAELARGHDAPRDAARLRELVDARDRRLTS